MQKTLRPSVLPRPAQALSGTNRATQAIARSAAAARLGDGWSLVQVWRAGWEAFVAWAAPILGLAVLGWAGPAVLFLGLAHGLGISDYARVSGPLVTYQGLALLNTNTGGAFGLLLAQAGLALLAGVSAQAGITAVVLRGSVNIHLSHVWRAWPALLLSTLLRGMLLIVPAVAINLPLRVTAYDLNNLGQKAYTAGGMAQVMALRTFNELIAAPYSPFNEFMPRWRQTLGRWPKSGDDYTQRLATEYSLPDLAPATTVTVHWADSFSARIGFVVACTVAFLLVESLLRLQPVAILHARALGQTTFTGFLRGTQLSLRVFWRVAAHSWGLRFGFCTVALLFATLPQVICESVGVASEVERILAWASLAPVGAVGFVFAWAMLHAVWLGFCATCDVRLYTHLSKD